MNADRTIRAIKGRRVWDSRGRPTIEAEVALDGASGRAIAPAGASRGAYEAVDLRDGSLMFGGLGVEKALEAIATNIAPAILGMQANDQKALDARLIALDGTRNKSRLGANATIAVSMAAAHAAAAADGMSLWRYLNRDETPKLPMPMVQIFGGGAHAGRRIDLQDILLVPIGAASFEEAIVMSAEVYRAAGELMKVRGLLRGVADEGGWWPEFASNEEALEQATLAISRAGFTPGRDVSLAVDVAASQFHRDGRYRLAATGEDLDRAGMVKRVAAWCSAYPIISIEDPLAEDDDEGMRAVTAAIGSQVQIIGDDYLVTSADRIARAAAAGACNAALIKPNQVGTLTETRAAFDAARAVGWRTIISARSGESEDVTIVHLAVGWGADQLKVGSFARSERMAKWNEGIRIEEQLIIGASFVGRSALRETTTTLAAE